MRCGDARRDPAGASDAAGGVAVSYDASEGRVVPAGTIETDGPVRARAPWLRADGLRLGLLLLVWAAETGILIGVGHGVVHSSTVNDFDHHVTSIVVAHRGPFLNALMKGVTWLGSWIAVVVVAGVLLVLSARRILPWIVTILAVLAWGGEAGGVALAKHLVQRHRPPHHLWLVTAHGSSWPSGHTATAVVVFTVLAVVVLQLVHGVLFRAVTCTFAVLAVLAVGYSRVELGVHWTTDVIASVAFVATWLAAMVALLRRPAASRRFEVSDG